MLDVLEEKLLSLDEVADIVPPGQRGKKRCPESIERWVLVGSRGPSGRVFLKAIRLGSRWFSRKSWIDEFIAALTPPPPPPRSNPPLGRRPGKKLNNEVKR